MISDLDRLIEKLSALGVPALFAIAEDILPENEWFVFKLHYQEGFNARQIAKATGIPRSTIRSRIDSGTAKVVREFKLREAA